MEQSLIISLLITFLIYGSGIGFVLLTLLIIFSNPFKPFTFVRTIFSTGLLRNNLELYQNYDMIVSTSKFWRLFGWIKSGAHIFKNAQLPVKPVPGETVEEIIENLHKIRFNPTYPFMISGDHFSVFYPRNLGIFYYPMIDPRVALNEDDWLRREQKYLQSAAYALEAFSQAGNVYTTIVPAGRRRVTCINIFAYPSDTLYGMLHALYVMQHPEYFEEIYPFSTGKKYTLHTIKAAKKLVSDYKDDIAELYNRYKSTVYDESTGLVKKELRVSSSLDTKIRQSAFYDNVMLWKTSEFVQLLGVVPKNERWMKEYKQRILEMFWQEEEGIFLDDLSTSSIEKKRYSSDWLIGLMTGFIHPSRPAELSYFERSVSYIRKHKIDKPFPLKIIGSDKKSQDHGIVSTFVPNYQDNTIWSNWGVQYIKLMGLLYSYTGKKSYQEDGEHAVQAYRKNILKWKGYPELYDSNGNMLIGRFYRSLLRLGWVVDFEHAQALFTYWSNKK